MMDKQIFNTGIIDNNAQVNTLETEKKQVKSSSRYTSPIYLELF